jgi:xanthine/uracil/vitamin C permease (AzgA family)
VAGGIGLFITFIGLKNAGFIVSNQATLVGMGILNAVTVTFMGYSDFLNTFYRIFCLNRPMFFL